MKSPRSAVHQSNQILDQQVFDAQFDNLNSIVDDINNLNIDASYRGMENNEPQIYRVDNPSNQKLNGSYRLSSADTKSSVIDVLKSLHARNPTLKSTKKRPKSSDSTRK